VPWEQVAALYGGTFVIYMGLAKLDQMVARLIASGLAPETPAIVVQAASTGIQRSVDAPLSELCLECKRQRLKPPALVVIGEAVRSRVVDKRIGTESLTGKTVLVTSPAQSTARICRLLRSRGADPIPYPAVIRKPVDDAEGWTRFQRLVNSGGLCLLRGEMEAGCFIEGLLAHGLDMRSLGRFKILALDASAKAALIERGIRADGFIEHFDRKELAHCISTMDPDESLPLIWVRGDLKECPLEREALSLTVCLDSAAGWESHWTQDLIENPPDYMAFTSVAEVEGFVELLGVDTARRLASKSCVAAMGSSVAEALYNHGLPVEIKTPFSSAEDFVGALVNR
jgi:uroporphyrinogen III methyltransferase/synthase